MEIKNLMREKKEIDQFQITYIKSNISIMTLYHNDAVNFYLQD